MIRTSPCHVAPNLQVVRPARKRGHVTPLEIVLHNRIGAPSGLISLDTQHRDPRHFGMVHLRVSEWPGGGKAKFIDEVAGGVYPARDKVHAVGRFDGVEYY